MTNGISIAVKRAANGLILTFRHDDPPGESVAENHPTIASSYEKARGLIEDFLDRHLKDAPKPEGKKK